MLDAGVPTNALNERERLTTDLDLEDTTECEELGRRQIFERKRA